jgi:hypothetical protein
LECGDLSPLWIVFLLARGRQREGNAVWSAAIYRRFGSFFSLRQTDTTKQKRRESPHSKKANPSST